MHTHTHTHTEVLPEMPHTHRVKYRCTKYINAAGINADKLTSQLPPQVQIPKSIVLPDGGSASPSSHEDGSRESDGGGEGGEGTGTVGEGAAGGMVAATGGGEGSEEEGSCKIGGGGGGGSGGQVEANVAYHLFGVIMHKGCFRFGVLAFGHI